MALCHSYLHIPQSTCEIRTCANLRNSTQDEEIREKAWKVGPVLAEAAIVAVKKGGKVEVTINVSADLGVQITAREVDGKGGVRGNIPKPKAMENGSA